jgi:hypothetical protein
MARANNKNFLTNETQQGKVTVVLFNASVTENKLETAQRDNLITYKVYDLKITMMRWAGRTARIEKLISAYNIGVRKSQKKISVGR